MCRISVVVVVLKLALCFHTLFLNWHVDGATTPQQIPRIFQQEKMLRTEKSEEMLKYIYPSVKPCEDFYSFACGNWQKHHGDKKEEKLLTTHKFLEKKIDADLEDLLAEISLSDSDDERKVKNFYKSCYRESANAEHQKFFFSEFIKKNGGFPAMLSSNGSEAYRNYNWQETVANLRYNYGMDILIGTRVDSNPLNPLEDTIILSEPSTIIPNHVCNTHIDGRKYELRKELQEIKKKIKESLVAWLNIKSSDAQKVANNITDFEIKLCKAIKEKFDHTESSILENHNYTRAVLHSFTDKFNDSIDFFKYVSTSYNAPFPKPVIMASESYYENLVKIIAETEGANIANYIMYRALSMLSFPFQDKEDERFSSCAKIARRFFPYVVGLMYYRKFGDQAGRADVESIYKNLKEVFEKRLRSSWIEGLTSRFGLQKLDALKLYFPTYEDKLSLDHLTINVSDYWYNLGQAMHLLQTGELKRLFGMEGGRYGNEVEAYDTLIRYTPRYQRIDIGWAMLQPPFYQAKYPHSMQYAVIGQKIGREIAIAFNDLSWQSDPSNMTNWDQLTSLAYKNLTECFRKQISYYLKKNSYSFRNKTELRNIIAMTAGVNTAFEAYNILLEYLDPYDDSDILTKETLPNMNFTNTQLFFLTYAQMNCHVIEAKLSFPRGFPSLLHSLDRYKINGALWNNIEFGVDYRCEMGSEMNRANKCFIY